MRALILRQPGTLEIGEISDPVLQSGDVLLRIRMVGLCGSDLNSYRGKNPMVSYPRIPGHEISAIVEAKASDVPDSVAIGTPVTLSPYTACGRCAACKRGRFNACQFNQTLGVQRDGALTDRIAVPWQKLLTAQQLTTRQLCMVEPLTVGYHAARRGRTTSADTVAVMGCGMVGLGAIAGAAHLGARVIAIDVDARKLDLAKRMGAAEAINSRSSNLHQALSDFTDGMGPDVVIEAIGLPETFCAAVEEVAFTGRVVYIGYAKDVVTYDTRLFVQKELDILGSRNALPEDFSGVIAMLTQRDLPLEQTVSHVVPLDEAAAAFRQWAADPHAVSKILIDMN